MSHQMINVSTLSVPADAEPFTFIATLSVPDKRGALVPCKFALAAPSLFVVTGDALVTGVWNSRPAPGNHIAHVTATAIAGGASQGALAVVINIIPAMGGSIFATPRGGTPVTGAGPDDMIVTPLG